MAGTRRRKLNGAPYYAAPRLHSSFDGRLRLPIDIEPEFPASPVASLGDIPEAAGHSPRQSRFNASSPLLSKNHPFG